ncbi:hypothetical protein CTAYLR_005544 [Chrysophaeum taylorii]|uniref:Uncharacterized protein n=1 Tax=Chrysophaeum taylorii TaxID=2483200 RepID=A0AAD7XQ44_9STRA|nr:hypothetical protein CTAYLR_005544 [Chrysophaeum taylorii]
MVWIFIIAALLNNVAGETYSYAYVDEFCATTSSSNASTCINGTLIDFEMFDTSGDGWNGACFTIRNAECSSCEVEQGTLSDGYQGTRAVCVRCDAPGSYVLAVTAGDNPSEISWQLGNLVQGSFVTPEWTPGQYVPTEIETVFACRPTTAPTSLPSIKPSDSPISKPTVLPSIKPSDSPISTPTVLPSIKPSDSPISTPTVLPSTRPSSRPTHAPTAGPKPSPTPKPSSAPLPSPTVNPSSSPISKPTVLPSNKPVSSSPTKAPSLGPYSYAYVDEFCATTSSNASTCINGTLIDFEMFDTSGDGWNGACFTIRNAECSSCEVEQGTLSDGYQGTQAVCVRCDAPGSYVLTVTAGDNPSEISWQLGNLVQGSFVTPEWTPGQYVPSEIETVFACRPTTAPTSLPSIKPSDSPISMPTYAHGAAVDQALVTPDARTDCGPETIADVQAVLGAVAVSDR